MRVPALVFIAAGSAGIVRVPAFIAFAGGRQDILGAEADDLKLRPFVILIRNQVLPPYLPK